MIAGKSGGAPSIIDSALGRSVVVSETTAGVTQFTDVSMEIQSNVLLHDLVMFILYRIYC